MFQPHPDDPRADLRTRQQTQVGRVKPAVAGRPLYRYSRNPQSLGEPRQQDETLDDRCEYQFVRR
jgi:hypothetical protein